jgi:hypothetical protein
MWRRVWVRMSEDVVDEAHPPTSASVDWPTCPSLYLPPIRQLALVGYCDLVEA